MGDDEHPSVAIGSSPYHLKAQLKERDRQRHLGFANTSKNFS